MINNLYDMIRIAARPDLILFDPKAEVDLEDFDENSFQPRPCNTPRETVYTVSLGKVNENWWRLLGSIHQEV